MGFEKTLTDRQTDGQRRTDDGHKVMGKAPADRVSWAKNIPKLQTEGRRIQSDRKSPNIVNRATKKK